MVIRNVGAKRGEIQRGSGNTESLQDIANKAANKPNQRKIIRSFTDSLQYNPAHNNRPDVRRILELAKSDPAQAVEFIELLAKGLPLPEAQDKNSGRETGVVLAAPQQNDSGDQLTGIRYGVDENGLAPGSDVY